MVLRSEMNLTADQHAQLKKIALENRKDVALHLGNRDLALSLRGSRDAVLADEPNESNIRKAADVHANAVADAAIAISKVTQQGKKVRPKNRKGWSKSSSPTMMPPWTNSWPMRNPTSNRPNSPHQYLSFLCQA
ncbi:MAG: hypothetical protein U0903_05810 [Planctomycetales bacterium]